MRLENITLFDGIYAELYDEMYSSLSPVDEFVQVESFCNLPKTINGNIIDVGGGTGRFSRILSERCKTVYLVEPSIEMIQIARNKLFKISNIEYINKKAEEFKVDNFASAAFLFFSVASYFNSPQIFETSMKNITSNLRPGSFIYFDIWHANEDQLMKLPITTKTFLYKNQKYLRKIEPIRKSLVEIQEGFYSINLSIEFTNLDTKLKYIEVHNLCLVTESWLIRFFAKFPEIINYKIHPNPRKVNNLEVYMTIN
jgi:ubiquinone/menaquinone biosynthesis C-methylase UbiE